MDGDLLFRVLFLVLFILGVMIRGYCTRRVQATRERRSIKERFEDTVQAEGKAAAVLLIGQGIYLIIIVPLYLLFSPSLSWFRLPVPGWLRWLGVGLGVFCLPFLAWIHYVLDKHWSSSLTLQEDHALVTSGPYRWIRHPMYTVHIVYFFTWVLVSANLLLLINYLLTIILISARIPKEEQMLLDQFGDEYRAYMKRTGRLLPRFGRKTNRKE